MLAGCLILCALLSSVSGTFPQSITHVTKQGDTFEVLRRTLSRTGTFELFDVLSAYYILLYVVVCTMKHQLKQQDVASIQPFRATIVTP